MKYLKRFFHLNEEIGNSKLLKFYQDYKNLFEDDIDSNIELYNEVGDATVAHKMTKEEVGEVLKSFDCSFDVDRLLQSTYDNWIDEDSWSSSTLFKKSDLISFAEEFEKEYSKEHVGSAEAFFDTWYREKYKKNN